MGNKLIALFFSFLTAITVGIGFKNTPQQIPSQNQESSDQSQEHGISPYLVLDVKDCG